MKWHIYISATTIWVTFCNMKTNLFIFMGLILFYAKPRRGSRSVISTRTRSLYSKPTICNIHVRTGWPKKRKKSQRGKERHIRRVSEGASKQANQYFIILSFCLRPKQTRLCMPPPLFLPPTQQQSPVLSSSSSCFLLFCAGQFVNCNHPPGSFSFWVFLL